MGSHADRIAAIRRLYGDNPDVAWLTAEVEQSRSWLRWVLDVKGTTCRYDHHDYCQAHNLDERPCPVEQIVAYFTADNPSPDAS